VKRPAADRLFGALVMLPFAAAIAWLHWAGRAPLKAFVFGSGSWGVGCIVKMALYHGIVRRQPHDREHLLRTSLLNGAVSGVTELSAGLLLLGIYTRVVGPMSLAELVAFGIGIGTIEAFLVATPGNPLRGTGLEKGAAEVEAALAALPGFQGVLHNYALPLAERLIATGIHVGTRGLIYITLRAGNPLPALIALAAFVAADGPIGYRMLYEGRLKDPAVLRRVMLALLAVALVELAAFAVFWRSS